MTENLPATIASSAPAVVDRWMANGLAALDRAATNFDRIKVRREAAAVAAAAAVLKAREVEAKASVLVADAERAIAKANPPKTRQETGRGHKVAITDGDLTSREVRDIRNTHAKLTDDEYADVRAEVLDGGKPLSRRRVAEVGRKLSRNKRRDDVRADREAARGVRVIDPRADIRLCSCAALADDLGPESVDLIVTDPPYVAESFGVWEELGAAAAVMLRPGGSLLAMTGCWNLPDVMDGIRAGAGDGIGWHWMLIEAMESGFAKHFDREIQQAHKPWLWFAKGNPLHPMTPDLITGHKDAHADIKGWHEWGQSMRGVLMVLQAAGAKPGDLVADPFLGGGTTGVAALAMDCAFVGCDIDPEAVEAAKERLSA